MPDDRLATLHPAFGETRLAAHRLAVYVVSPARRLATGRIGLRAAEGAVFATPPFDGRAVRLEPDRLVVARDGAREEAPVTTLRAAAAFVLGGPPDLEYPKDFDVPEPGDVDAPLPLDPAAAAQLGAWYRFGAGVLAVMRDEGGEGAGEIQLWPEHFDIAVEVPCGVGRMMFGASPGDGTSDEPYLYVLPPGPVERSGTWNARGFAGAALPLSGFAGAADHRAAALAFLRSRRDAVP